MFIVSISKYSSHYDYFHSQNMIFTKIVISNFRKNFENCHL